MHVQVQVGSVSRNRVNKLTVSLASSQKEFQASSFARDVNVKEQPEHCSGQDPTHEMRWNSEHAACKQHKAQSTAHYITTISELISPRNCRHFRTKNSPSESQRNQHRERQNERNLPQQLPSRTIRHAWGLLQRLNREIASDMPSDSLGYLQTVPNLDKRNRANGCPLVVRSVHRIWRVFSPHKRPISCVI